MRALAPLAALAAALALAAPLGAQSPAVWAEVDRASATTDDIVTLSVVVEGGNQVSPPRLPDLDGLAVVGTTSLSSISVVSGKMTSSFLFEYRLAPTRPGRMTIGPIEVVVDGASLLTDPIEIDVAQGTGAAAVPTARPDFDFGPASGPSSLAGQDHHIEAGVDDANPYLGQQVTYSRHYYAAADGQGVFFLRRSYVPPSFDGFWHRDLSDEGRYEESAAGRLYDVYEERTVLFPSLVGRLTIDPALMRIQSGLGEPVEELATRAVTVDVRPLPVGAPSGFDGAVGEYNIRASVDSDRLTGGDPATLTVTVAGTGNIDALPEPVVPDSGDWRVFSEGASSHSQVVRGVLRGSKTFTYLLLPSTDGALSIPPIEYVYFDPDRETYVTASTDPIRVEVEPGSVDMAAVNPAGAQLEEGSVADAGPMELRPLDGPVSEAGRGFELRWWHLALLTAPALVIAAVEAARHLGALGAALGRGRGPGHAVPDLSGPPARRLRAYLSGRLGGSSRWRTGDGLMRELGARGAGEGLIAEVVGVMEAADAAEFAPPGARPEGADLGREVDDLIARLEEALR